MNTNAEIEQEIFPLSPLVRKVSILVDRLEMEFYCKSGPGPGYLELNIRDLGYCSEGDDLVYESDFWLEHGTPEEVEKVFPEAVEDYIRNRIGGLFYDDNTDD